MKMRCLQGSASQSDVRSATRVQEWLFSKYWNPREDESLKHLPVRQTTLLAGAGSAPSALESLFWRNSREGLWWAPTWFHVTFCKAWYRPVPFRVWSVLIRFLIHDLIYCFELDSLVLKKQYWRKLKVHLFTSSLSLGCCINDDEYLGNPVGPAFLKGFTLILWKQGRNV